MADVGGVGGFNPATTRSDFDADAAAQRRAEERERQEAIREEQRVEQQEEALEAEEAAAEREQAEQQSREDLQDEVVLSNAAQEFLTRSQDEAQAANDDAVAAAEAAEAGAQATQVGGVDGTNQQTADEENNATVNGSQDDESEQTRALGQIVDQFA